MVGGVVKFTPNQEATMNRNPINAATPEWAAKSDATPKIAMDAFSYDKNLRTFYAEASSIPATPTNAYDIKGYSRTYRFTYIESERDAEGEVTSFRFSGPAGYSLVLFND